MQCFSVVACAVLFADMQEGTSAMSAVVLDKDFWGFWWYGKLPPISLCSTSYEGKMAIWRSAERFHCLKSSTWPRDQNTKGAFTVLREKQRRRRLEAWCLRYIRTRWTKVSDFRTRKEHVVFESNGLQQGAWNERCRLLLGQAHGCERERYDGQKAQEQGLGCGMRQGAK